MSSNQFSGSPRGSNRSAFILEVVKRGQPVFNLDGGRIWYYKVAFTFQGCTVEVRWYTGECNLTGEDLLLITYDSFQDKDQILSGKEGGSYFLSLVKAIKELK